MSRFFHYLTCSLLLMTGWANALAQAAPTTSPVQRLNLELVDNQSTFVIDEENGNRNEYTNTFRLTQPTDYKLTAGMLNEGDNYITVSRQGIKDGETIGDPTDFARINLQADITKHEAEELTDITLSSTSAFIGQAGWSLSGSATQTLYYSSSYNGCSINSGYYIRYTIPEGYDGGTILLYIAPTSSGYIKINNGNAQNPTSGDWNRYVLYGLSSGSTITIQGCNSSGNNANSPYIYGIVLQWAAPTIVPTISVTPKLSYKVDGNWLAETTLDTKTDYQPNDYIDFFDVIDTFSISTADNSHPNSYNYSAEIDANIDWTSADMTGDFYASADYGQGDGTTAGIVLTGYDGWDYQFINTKDGEIMCLWFYRYGLLMYTMPNTFAGTNVDVTITADTGTYGAGSILVNGNKHDFTPGETYTWEDVPVSANGTILFSCNPDESYTLDVSKIVISSGNGTAQNAPLVTGASMQHHSSMMNDKRFISLSKSLSVKK